MRLLEVPRDSQKGDTASHLDSRMRMFVPKFTSLASVRTIFDTHRVVRYGL